MDFWQSWARATGNAAGPQADMKTPAWPGVGRVDIELVSKGSEGVERTWIEVKWHDLWNCAWDLPKMALALREGLCQRALLIAAAPEKEWLKPGGEFFSTAEWDVASQVMLAHRSSWLYWKRQVKTHPLRLPAKARTQLVAEPDAFTVPGHLRWSLRAVHVHVDHDRSWIAIDEERLPRAL